MPPRPPISRGLRRSTVTSLLLVLLGAVLLGLPAVLLALRDYPTYESTVQIRLLPDPLIGDEVAAGEPGSFIATELVTLNGRELRDAVSERQDIPDLVVEAVQVGSSNVVEVTTRAGQRDVDGASRSLRARYVEVRRRALDLRINAVTEVVIGQVRAAQQEIDRLAGDESVTGQVQRAAVTSEFTRLLARRNDLMAAAESSDRLIQVLTDEAAEPRQIVSPVQDGVVGAVGGAALGLAGALALSRLRPRVRGLQDLMEFAPDVALPTMPRLYGRGLARQAGDAASSYVSALITPTQEFGQPPLVIVAPTPGCGATVLAVGLAVASARRRPTLFVAAGDVLDGHAADLLGVDLSLARGEGQSLPTLQKGLRYLPVMPGSNMSALAELDGRVSSGLLEYAASSGGAVVVDAPALSVSPAGLELARQTRQVLLVGGIDTTFAAELDSSARSLRRVGAVLAGVVLNTPTRSRTRRRTGNV